MTDEELIYWQAILDDSYDGFVGIVAEGRGLTDEEVRELADGRVFTGQQALELGLVDEIGYFEDAIAKAADLGGLSGEVNVIELEPLPSFFDYVAAAQSGQGLLPSALDIVELMSQPSLEYRYLGP
jgi:protease-4